MIWVKHETAVAVCVCVSSPLSLSAHIHFVAGGIMDESGKLIAVIGDEVSCTRAGVPGRRDAL